MGGPGAARGRGAACIYITEQSIIKTAPQTDGESVRVAQGGPSLHAGGPAVGIIFPAHSTLYRPAI